MSLYSIDFLFFLLFIVIVYYRSPQRWRWVILLIASGFFYLTYSFVFAGILVLVILVNYVLGLQLARLPKDKRGWLLWSGIVFNIGLLFFYKFVSPLLAESLPLFEKGSFLADLTLLPIGLSFHVLQAVSYLVEIRRGGQMAERHVGIFALTILFFPRVLAGPIEQPSFIGQFRTNVNFNYKDVTEGMKIMAWGFFKKMVIADRLTETIYQAYSQPTSLSGISLLFPTLVFTFALYADFSGYSDIALGAARIFGIKLTQNFQHPYSARSISEFWQRWHISLSNWLRDYIFFPVRRFLLRRWGGKYPFLATIIPPLVTMLACGLWHGSTWNFILWGGLHGVYLIFFQLTEGFWQRITHAIHLDRLPKLVTLIQQAVTFTLVVFSHILFRANTLGDAYYIWTHLFDGLPKFLILSVRSIAISLVSLDQSRIYHALLKVFRQSTLTNGFDGFLIFSAFVIIIILEWTQFDLTKLSTKPVLIRWMGYMIFLVVALLFSVNSVLNKEFIYFKF